MVASAKDFLNNLETLLSKYAYLRCRGPSFTFHNGTQCFKCQISSFQRPVKTHILFNRIILDIAEGTTRRRWAPAGGIAAYINPIVGHRSADIAILTRPLGNALQI